MAVAKDLLGDAPRTRTGRTSYVYVAARVRLFPCFPWIVLLCRAFFLTAFISPSNTVWLILFMLDETQVRLSPPVSGESDWWLGISCIGPLWNFTSRALKHLMLTLLQPSYWPVQSSTLSCCNSSDSHCCMGWCWNSLLLDMAEDLSVIPELGFSFS